MLRQRWTSLAKFSVLLALPVVIWSFSSGAPAKHTGAPGDATCLACHAGTSIQNSPNLDVLWEGGVNYQPGTRQRFTVRLNNATGRRYGMQATARLESNTIGGQAGTFTPIDNSMYVICADDRDRPSIGCPPSNPVEFITHTRSSTSTTFTFDWTPPQNASAGAAIIYVALNEITGAGTSGSRVHLKSLRLQPGAGGGGVRPVISQGGVIQVSNFGGGPRVSSGSYLEIFGRDLALTTRSWGGGDFDQGTAPTNLDNVQVTVGGRAAFVNFVSPGQVNIVVPDGLNDGPTDVVVRTPGGDSDPIPVTIARRTPGILAPPSFRVNNVQYVVAQFADGAFAGRENLISGVNFRTPRPGDRLVIYGVGFGPTTPAVAAGRVVTTNTDLGSILQVNLANAPVTTEFRGLAPNFVGLYQFNIVVPNVPAGDHPLTFTIDGQTTQSGVFLTTAN